MKIIPCLWFKEDLEKVQKRVDTYISLFGGEFNWSHAIESNNPDGASILSFSLADMEIAGIVAGSPFQLNESISFMVACPDETSLRKVYDTLAPSGRVLMPLDNYHFSSLYAWIEDECGVNWQLMLNQEGPASFHFDICYLFSGKQVGQALPALESYSQWFPTMTIDQIHYYDGSQSDDRAKINYANLKSSQSPNQWIFMDHGMTGVCEFNEAFSMMVFCEDQQELDDLWAKVSAVPQAEQCGWVKDAYGISWQILPDSLWEAYQAPEKHDLKSMQEAILQVKKINFDTIEGFLHQAKED